ncbi:MAG: glycosyltransferase family 2 protein [Leptolyngbya sp. Prado105]|jgi:glycosyltransferase involved in cell wall biosynthesis|nr:glycosyltransferase family 2 protein [Leptolyngbya sp. Prado105]
MHEKSLVSVIIPAYNAESYITQTLDSVLLQTYPYFEAIVVDDGSVDRTVKLVEQYTQRDSRIKLIRQNHAGVVAARNLAIAHSTGIYLAPLDSDDIWYPEKLEKQVRCLDEHPELGLVYSWSVTIDKYDRIIGRYYRQREHIPAGHVFPTLIFYNFMENGSVPMFRRNCVDRVGDYALPIEDLKLQGCEDWDLFLRIAKVYPVGVVPEYLVGYRQGTGGLSSKHIAMYESYLQMLAMLKRQNPEIPAVIFRWSQATYYNYVLAKSYASRDFRQVLCWFWEGVRLDPALLLRPEVHRVAIMSLLNVLIPKYSPKPTPPSDDPPTKTVTIEEANDPTHKRRYPWLRKPYDLLLLYRWTKVMKISQRLATEQLEAQLSHQTGLYRSRDIAV